MCKDSPFIKTTIAGLNSLARISREGLEIQCKLLSQLCPKTEQDKLYPRIFKDSIQAYDIDNHVALHQLRPP